MDLNLYDINVFNIKNLKKFLNIHLIDTDDLEIDDEEDCYDIYQSIALSLMLKIDINSFKLHELCNSFNIQDNELINMLFESTNYNVTSEILLQIKESYPESPIYTCIKIIKSNEDNYIEIPKYIQVENIIVLLQQNNNDILTNNNDKIYEKIININSNLEMIKLNLINLTNKELYNTFGSISLPRLKFGYYKWDIYIKGKRKSQNIESIENITGRFTCISTAYSYAQCYDNFFDVYIYGWGYGGIWTEELESSLLELLIGVNEDLEAAIKSWQPMMAMLGGAAKETNQMLEIIKTDVSLALNCQSTYAIGRLHQTLSQLLESGTEIEIMALPKPFQLAIEKFINSKIISSPVKPLRSAFLTLISIMPAYIENLGNTYEKQRLTMLYQTLQLYHIEGKDDHALSINEITALRNLKPKSMEMFSSNPISLIPDDEYKSSSIVFCPILQLEAFQNKQSLDYLAYRYSEILCADVLNIGSMLGYNIGLPHRPNIGADMIIKLLDSGFSYVCTSGGKLMAMLPMKRSVLNLSLPNFPKKITKKLKSLPRMFRNRIIHNLPELSLKLNTNFDLSLSKLRDHHGDDCWVGSELESVWKVMYENQPPQLMVFELWLGDELIAADFGHPTSNFKSYYVATRFFDRNNSNPQVRQLNPGFMNSFASIHYLKELGVKLWDMGSIDLCPLMQYKLDLTGEPLDRPESLALFIESAEEEKEEEKKIIISEKIKNLKSNITIYANLNMDNIVDINILK